METQAANNLTAFYQGDATYTESVSANVPITISNFALASPGATAAVGSAAIAPVTVNVANNYTTPISLHLHHAVQPDAIGLLCESQIDDRHRAGLAHRQHHTTASPESARAAGVPGWLAAGGGASLACLSFCSAFPRRRWRGKAMFLF